MVDLTWIMRSVTVLLLFTTLKADQADFEIVCPWQQSFSDQFTDGTLDRSKWNTEYGSGGNGEQQYYAPDAFVLQNGILKIKAEKRAMKGYPYTSGIITTQGTFSQKHGYFKLRAKAPKGQGFWPAFWMLTEKKTFPWEIDVLEILGHDPTTAHLTIHWPDAKGVPQKAKQVFTGPDFSEDFHIYTLEWNEKEVIWSVDYVEQFRVTQGIPVEPMFLLINLAVGGEWPGNPNATTVFPSYYEIDYVEVYEKQCTLYLPWIGTSDDS